MSARKLGKSQILRTVGLRWKGGAASACHSLIETGPRIRRPDAAVSFASRAAEAWWRHARYDRQGGVVAAYIGLHVWLIHLPQRSTNESMASLNLATA